MDDDHVQRLAAAMLLSAMLGLNRALSSERGGMLTHTLIGVGACLYHKSGDGSVMLAAAVLSSATIMKSTEGVRGINSAVSVWVAAGVGATCAENEIALAAVGSTLCVLAQGINRLVLHLKRRNFLPVPDNASSAS